MLMPGSHFPEITISLMEVVAWASDFYRLPWWFLMCSSLRSTGTEISGLKPSFGTVWPVICEALFASVLLTTRWSIVHMTAIQQPGFCKTHFGRLSRRHPGSIEKLLEWDRSVSRFGPGFCLTLYPVVSIYLFKVLGRIILFYNWLCLKSEKYSSLVFPVCLFLDLNYRKSSFVERPHPLLFGCKGKMECCSLEIS